MIEYGCGLLCKTRQIEVRATLLIDFLFVKTTSKTAAEKYLFRKLLIDIIIVIGIIIIPFHVCHRGNGFDNVFFNDNIAVF